MNLLVTNLKLFSSYCKINTRKILQFENEIYIYIYSYASIAVVRRFN